MAGTNYSKWDSYVAGLSDEDDSAPAAPAPQVRAIRPLTTLPGKEHQVLSRGGGMQAPIVPVAAPEPNIGAGHGNALRPDGTIQHLGGFIVPALGASLAVSLSPVSLTVSTVTLTPLCLLPRGLSLSLSVSRCRSL